jgi:hypothetical protein
MNQLIIVAFASLQLFLAGCSTEKITDYQPASPPVSERTAQASGVEVALDPFVDSQRTKQYFDIDAVAEGIAIVHVRVINKTADQTFLVEKKDFQLLPDGAAGDLTGDKKIERAPEPGVGPATPASVLFGNPFVGSGGFGGLWSLSRSSKFYEIQRNFTDKEMADATLSPGQSMEGFVYFMPVKKGEDWTRATTIRINLTETKTRQMTTLNIPLSH